MSGLEISHLTIFHLTANSKTFMLHMAILFSDPTFQRTLSVFIRVLRFFTYNEYYLWYFKSKNNNIDLAGVFDNPEVATVCLNNNQLKIDYVYPDIFNWSYVPFFASLSLYYKYGQHSFVKLCQSCSAYGRPSAHDKPWVSLVHKPDAEWDHFKTTIERNWRMAKDSIECDSLVCVTHRKMTQT